jgi:hypothetical protein
MGRSKRSSKWITTLLAAGLLATAASMAWIDGRSSAPVFGLPWLLAIGTLAALAVVIHFATRSTPPAAEADEGNARPPAARYDHLGRPIGLLVLALGTAATIRACFVPDSWGKLGAFRADALKEALVVSEPLHVGEAQCVRCHEPNVRKHDKDVHARVECESCHGPGARHLPLAVERELEAAEERPFVPKTKDPCLWCHRRLAARPARFPQIDPVEHYAFLGVTDPETPCMRCHDPHEPLFLSTPVQQARLHPGIQLCGDCHDEQPATDALLPAEHPPVFECTYCHEEIAQDVAGRAHGALGCRRCHVYFPESENAGRIIKNADPRFCLLCHRATPFRKGAGIPLVEWPAHALAQKPPGTAAQCVECHANAVHLKNEELRQRAHPSR